MSPARRPPPTPSQVAAALRRLDNALMLVLTDFDRDWAMRTGPHRQAAVAVRGTVESARRTAAQELAELHVRKGDG